MPAVSSFWALTKNRGHGPLQQSRFAPQKVVEGALVAITLKIDFSLDEHHAFLFQQILLLLETRAVRGKGDFPLGVDHPMPGQRHAARRPPHGLAHPSRRPAHAGQASHFAVGQDMTTRNSLHHLPHGFHPYFEVGCGGERTCIVLLIHAGLISMHTVVWILTYTR